MPRDPASRFAIATIVASVCVLAAALALGDLRLAADPATLLLTAFVIGGEFLPLRLPTERDDIRISTSSLFAVALLVVSGVGPAVLAFALSAVLLDVMGRRPPIKVLFNAAQSALSVVAAGAVFAAAGSTALAIAPAGIVLHAVNTILVGLVTAKALRLPPLNTLVRDGRESVLVGAALTAFSPIVIIVAINEWELLPLLLVPLVIIAYSSREADRRRHDALHDALTGLPNRVFFGRQVDRAIAAGLQGEGACAVLLLDLDGFKEVNDALGHGTGDKLLRAVAGRLHAIVKHADAVARLGGDEFAVLLATDPEGDAAVALAEEIRRGLDEPFVIGELRLRAAASVGVAISDRGSEDAQTLLRHADVAMYRAKEHSTGVERYDAADDPHTADRLALAAELREGIPRGELVLHYQPKVTPDSLRVDGVEALVRWDHPDRGLLFPGAFLPVAEGTDLMRPLTMAVLELAVVQIARWRALGIDLHVAVNVSADTLLDPDLPSAIARLLDEHALPAPSLQLELTEQTLMRDPQRAAGVLDDLGATGVRISIDDFGTGWSSLVWLKRLPLAAIKIDRSFVTDMLTSPNDAAIVESTIKLAHSLGLHAVAEGVEDEPTLARLRAFECDLVQGYLISRPAPPDALTPWLLGAEQALAA